MKIEFNDDVFNNVHLDWGNLYAFYSEAYRKGKAQARKECEEQLSIYAELKEKLEYISVAELWSNLVKENRILKQKLQGDEQ